MPRSLTLATFNLKDFFPQPPHDFSPKVAWVAGALRRIDADVVALQEVGPAETLDVLLASLDGRGGYGEPIVGTPDARGIRNALLSRAPILASRVHTADALPFPVFYEGDPQPFGGRIPLRRGVVVARIDGGALGPIDVLVAHFKSRRWVPRKKADGTSVEPSTPRERAEAELRSLVWRAAEALCVRNLVDEANASHPDAKVAVMGDLNDTIDSVPVRTVAGADLASCADIVLPEHRFSVMHGGARSQIDHILVTRPLRARLVAATFVNEALRDHALGPAARASNGDTSAVSALAPPPTEDSDHAPFVARFEAES